MARPIDSGTDGLRAWESIARELGIARQSVISYAERGMQKLQANPEALQMWIEFQEQRSETEGQHGLALNEAV